MDTAVGKISVHTVDLGQISGTADRAYIHLQFLMTTIVTVCKRKVHSFIISQIHGSADQCTDSFLIVADRITYILNLTAIQSSQKRPSRSCFSIGVTSSVTWQWKLLLTYGLSETPSMIPYILRNCSTCRPQRLSAGVP